ncbi:MAG: hypothetical protein F4Z04_05595 [Acidobacteria bacterium]|nr:hypothetical protein [Acidobacteriota bacterium]
MTRALVTAGLFLFAALLPSPALAQEAGGGLTMIDENGRQAIETAVLRDQEMIAVDRLAELFRFDLSEDVRTRTVTLSAGGRSVILTAEQALASVDGRLVSLAAPVYRLGGDWFVPLDFVNRALPSVAGQPVELRLASRLLLVGNVRIPRVAVRYGPRGEGGRLSLEVTPETPYEVIEEPGRLLIRFEAAAIDLAAPPAPRGNMVRAITHDETLPGLALDLGPAYGSYRVIGALPRFAVELEPADAAAADVSARPVPTTVLGDPASRPVLRTVVIDPGHGGDDEGTRGPNGTLEKHVTLAVAQRLRAALESRLGARVILTRTDDRGVPLDQRAAIANNNQADVFISLHANASLSEIPAGAEVFHLSIDEYGAEAREIAEREGEFLLAADGRQREIDMVPWELAQARYLFRSEFLADLVEEELAVRVPMNERPRTEAPFRVLAGANMPAVLIEMGYVSNPEQEAQLVDPVFQGSIVEALVAAIVRFRNRLEQGDFLPPDVEPPDIEATGAGDRRQEVEATEDGATRDRRRE